MKIFILCASISPKELTSGTISTTMRMDSNKNKNNSKIQIETGFLSDKDRDYLLFGAGDMKPHEKQERKNSIRDRTVAALTDFAYLVNLDDATRQEIFTELLPVIDQEKFPDFDNHSERILISPSIYLGVSHCIDFIYTSLGFIRFKKLLQISIFQAIFWECRNHFERVHPIRPEDIKFTIDSTNNDSSYLQDLFG